MRILGVIRQTRAYPLALRSIQDEIEESGIDTLWIRQPVVTEHERYVDGTARLQMARAMFLSAPYDAMLIIDDDLVLPPKTIHRLITMDKSVAMALTVRRTLPHLWSAVIRSNDRDVEGYYTLDRDETMMREAWGKIIRVVGCGHNPTLIKREVLEEVGFRREPGKHGADRYFALDCKRHGIEMWCHTGIQVGHQTEKFIVYPDLEHKVRKQVL